MLNRKSLLNILITLFFFLVTPTLAISQTMAGSFRVMEYNVENLFDSDHDSLKMDTQFTPDGDYHWTHGRYWRKLNAISRSIVLASTDSLTLLTLSGCARWRMTVSSRL